MFVCALACRCAALVNSVLVCSKIVNSVLVHALACRCAMLVYGVPVCATLVNGEQQRVCACACLQVCHAGVQRGPGALLHAAQVRGVAPVHAPAPQRAGKDTGGRGRGGGCASLGECWRRVLLHVRCLAPYPRARAPHFGQRVRRAAPARAPSLLLRSVHIVVILLGRLSLCTRAAVRAAATRACAPSGSNAVWGAWRCAPYPL